jgi:hypothetical protein
MTITSVPVENRKQWFRAGGPFSASTILTFARLEEVDPEIPSIPMAKDWAISMFMPPFPDKEQLVYLSNRGSYAGYPHLP